VCRRIDEGTRVHHTHRRQPERFRDFLSPPIVADGNDRWPNGTVDELLQSSHDGNIMNRRTPFLLIVVNEGFDAPAQFLKRADCDFAVATRADYVHTPVA
jgi:hypothetical protein